VFVKRPGKREKRLNVIAGESDNKAIAPVVYDWSAKHVWVEVWFEWYLCPLLARNSVIFLDNASWHKRPALEKIAAFYDFSIIWLPTYSPDKNHIQHRWANLKFWLQYNPKIYPSLQIAVLLCFLSC